MEATLGDHDLYERMDAMMGSDGSASLAQMHQRIDFDHLVGYPWGMMGVTPAALVSGGCFMMGGYYPGYGMTGGWGGIGMLIGLIVVVVVIF